MNMDAQLQDMAEENHPQGGQRVRAGELMQRKKCPIVMAVFLVLLLCLLIASTTVTSLLYIKQEGLLKKECEKPQTCQCSCENKSISDKSSSLENETCEELVGVVDTLSHLKNNTVSISSATNDILLLVKDVLRLQNVTNALPTSCREVNNSLPTNPSGYYHIKGHDVYCLMETLCGSVGPWTRVAYLDMSDATENCPPGFMLYTKGAIRACGRQTSDTASCQSVKYNTNGLSYSEVCGRVIGYQKGRTKAIRRTTNDPNHEDINSYYVDGVSITHGYPRQHIWTLMSGYSAGYSYGDYNCPCSTGSSQSSSIQSFIGNDYFCESGCPGNPSSGTLYEGDPLWDGQECSNYERDCCKAAGIPWFHKVLSSETTDNLELRVCADQGTSEGDVPVGYYEIFLK